MKERDLSVRVNLTIHRNENEFLVEHLLTLPKGAARVRRVTTLALIGLLTEKRVLGSPAFSTGPAFVPTQDASEEQGEATARDESTGPEDYRPRLTPEEISMLMGGRNLLSDDASE